MLLIITMDERLDHFRCGPHSDEMDDIYFDCTIRISADSVSILGSVKASFGVAAHVGTG